MSNSRRQSVRGFRCSSRGTGRPRAVKYSAIRACSYVRIDVVGERLQRRLGRAERLRVRALRSDLDLHGILAVDLLEAPFVDFRGPAVERDLAALQRDHAGPISARERE